MTTMTGAQALVKSLVRHGVDTIFSLPGAQLDHLYDAIHQEQGRIRLIHSRHEQGAAYMAYGYAKSTGRPGVYAVVPGAGLLNSSAALATAWANYAPVLCISGQVPSTALGKGYGELHEIPDQLGLVQHITKWARRIDRPQDTSAMVAEAFRQMATGGSRPVYLEMPMDLMAMETDAPLVSVAEGSKVEQPDPSSVNRAVELLMAAKRPLIYVGSGSIGAAAPLREVAERMQAPVATFRGGKGVLPDDSPLCVNLPVGHQLWGQADLVLAVGTRLHWPLTMWGKDADLTLIRVEIDPEEINRICAPDLGFIGDAKQVVQALAQRLAVLDFQAPSREEEVRQARARMDAEVRAAIPSLIDYLDVIRAALPQDGYFVDEVTQVGYASWYAFPVYAPRQQISSGYQGTLGFGYPTALGVVAGNPGKRVVQISGDGGILYNMQEIATAVQHQLPLVTIIFNDNRYTNVQRQQVEWFDGRVIASDLHNPDFVRLAQSFGAAGFRAEDPSSLQRAVKLAFNEPGPSIIEVRVDEFFPTPWRFLMLPQNRRTLCA